MHESPSQSRAFSLFADHLARVQRGESGDLNALCEAHPELAGELRDMDKSWKLAKNLLRESASCTDDGCTEVVSNEAWAGGDPSPDARSVQGQDAILSKLRERRLSKGRYERRAPIARGGMGEILKVWDDELKRELAMKVLLPVPRRSRNDDSRRLGRFLEEAQITGQLDHPGIVPVHGLGLDGDGRVFFTMRLVKGMTLEEVFDEVAKGSREWTVTRALNVILRVCEAVAFAHARGVVHRDLKPANIMVGRFGEAYVMDWGLAKVAGLEDDHDLRLQLKPEPTEQVKTVRTESDDERTSPLRTRDGDVVGTPAYMSPEQAKGELARIGPRSDVYSMGAILYHLLAGHMPYVPDGSRVTGQTVLTRVLGGPPQSLSRISPDSPAELVAICEKAMSRVADQRYADMIEMADDLRAYLEHRVVRAYRTGAVAELSKWVGRNKAVAAAIGVTGVLSLGWLGTALILKDRSEKQTISFNRELSDTNAELASAQEEAKQNFEQAFEAVGYLVSAAREELSEAPRTTQARQSMLERALAFYEGLLTKEAAQSEPRPEPLQAQVEAGHIHQALGNYSQALEYFATAGQGFADLASRSQGDREYAFEVANSHLYLGRALLDWGRYEEAKKELAGLIADLESAPTPFFGTHLHTKLLAYANLALGHALALAGGRAPDAQAAYSASLRHAQSMMESGSESDQIVAEATTALGWFQLNGFEYERADASFRMALEKWDSLTPTKQNHRLHQARAEIGLGRTLTGKGVLDAALSSVENGHQKAEALCDDFPAVDGYWVALAEAKHAMGRWQMKSNNLDESEEAHHECLVLLEGVLGDLERPPLRWVSFWGQVHESAATVQYIRGDLEEAARLYRGSVEIWSSGLESKYTFLGTTVLANAYRNLGITLMALSRKEEGIQAFESGLAALEKPKAQNPDDLHLRVLEAKLLASCSGAHASMWNTEGVLSSSRQAIAIWNELLDEREPGQDLTLSEYIVANKNYALALRYRGDPQAAVSALCSATERVEEAAPELFLNWRYNLSALYGGLGNALKDVGDLESAAQEHERAVQLARERYESYSTVETRSYYGVALSDSGEVLQRLGDFEQAKEQYEIAIALQRQSMEESPDYFKAKVFLRDHLSNLAEVLVDLGDGHGALRVATEALDFREDLTENLTDLARALGRAALAPDAAVSLDLLEGLAEAADKSIRQAIEQGFRDLQLLESHADFEGLRNQTTFKRLIEDLRALVDQE